jgi:trans-aconitate 2-methyltransferase
MTDVRWNAELYERIGTPMRRWARQVIEDLQLRGDETVLDAGCGSGGVTFDLLQRLPRGRVYALDGSAGMIAKLSRSLEERGIANVIPVHADLTCFGLPEPVDAVFSNAVFHWIADDDGLFGSLFRATKPGGRLRAQCGGAGNIARLMEATHAVQQREPFARHVGDAAEFRKYRSPEEVIGAMRRAGWSDVRATLFESPASFASHEEAALYLRTIILQRHVESLPPALQDPFLHAVIDKVVGSFGPPFAADYVRLDIWACRPAG